MSPNSTVGWVLHLNNMCTVCVLSKKLVDTSENSVSNHPN